MLHFMGLSYETKKTVKMCSKHSKICQKTYTDASINIYMRIPYSFFIPIW